jgi:hypothetical protein
MQTPPNFQEQSLYETVAHGSYGTFKMSIVVGANQLPDLEQESVRYAAYDAARLIESAVMEAIVKADPRTRQRQQEERAALVGLFSEPIYVAELPNGYSDHWSSKCYPWFEITTTKGRFKVGWRKRVIYVEWMKEVCEKTAAQLFPDEDVTKDGRMIHAWSIEDAKRYVARVLTS